MPDHAKDNERSDVVESTSGPELSGQFDGPVAVEGGEAVDARGSKGMVYKPSGPVFVDSVIQFMDEKVFQHLGLEQRVGFVVLGVLILGVGIGLYFALRPQQPTQMAGDFRIAVAGFAEEGQSGRSELGMQLAQDIYVRLDENFTDMELDFKVTVWGPDQVGQIRGMRPDERADSAEQIAEVIGADVVIYGLVDKTTSLWEITPEFYVAVDNFYEAEEVVGQYEIGDPFDIIGGNDARTRIELNDTLSPRVEVLSRITVGLARYAFHHFDIALETFEAAEDTEGIEEETGIKQVLYLLMGNAAGKIKDFETAEEYYLQAQALDSDYARPYAGLGNVIYIRAVDAYTEDEIEIALGLLEEAENYYIQALQAPDQPPLSDIDSKAHFGFGRIYLLRAIISNGDMALAAQEFQWVIDQYDQTKSERLRERAAEAHKLLGLVYRLNNEDKLSIEEHKEAIALIKDVPQLRGKLGEYYAALGEVLSEAGRFSEAVSAYENAIKFAVSVEMKDVYQDKLHIIKSKEKESSYDLP